MKTNILLTGMPGCGKTTLGKMLAQHLGWNFVDMDDNIEQYEGRLISDMFAEGEEIFREAESRCARRMSELTRTVISAGGGIVKDPSNMKSLASHAHIVFINRPPENIAADVNILTRPLLKNGSDRIYTLYSERINLYRMTSDTEVPNTKTLKDTLQEIIQTLPSQKGDNLSENNCD